MNLRPLKYFCDGQPVYGLNVSAERYVTSGVRFLRTTDVGNDGRLAPEDSGVFLDPRDVPNDHILRDGDLLFSRSGTLGRSLLFRKQSIPATHAGYLVRFRPEESNYSPYLAYCAQSRLMHDAVSADAIETTIGNFNAEKYANVRLPWWPRATQRAIADFLDRETARIDALISAKRRMVDSLQERSTDLFEAALNQRGFRFPTTLAPDWAEVSLPDGWRVMRLSQTLIRLTNGYVGPTRDILRDDGIRYVQSLHIKGGKIDFGRRPFFVDEEWHRERPRIHLRPNDVLIVQTGDIGQVAVVPDGFGEASCHALQIARVNPKIVSGQYLGAYLRSRFGYHSLLSRATGALHPHLEAGIRDVPVVVPPGDLQSRLLDDVERARAPITEIIRAIQKQSSLLQERRQALITAAVTAQIDISEAA